MAKGSKVKIKKKIKTNKEDKTDDSHPRKGFSLKKKQAQLSNTTWAERIIHGVWTTKVLNDIQHKKEMNSWIGKHSEVSIERYIWRMVREKKKLKFQQKEKQRRHGWSNQERSMITKLKKEPERNKTHWDNLLMEMKWMQADFEKERRNKKKLGYFFVKYTKKTIETKQVEIVKAVKRQETNLQKKFLLLSRTVKNYWGKIEKLTKFNYNIQWNEEKIIQQQNRLISFIAKLEKISTKVANYLGPGVNKKLNEQSTQLSFCSDVIMNDANTTTLNNNTKDEEINILLKKHEDGSYSIWENNLDENLITKAAQFAEQLQPKGTQLKEANITLKQPFLLNNILREYQLIGLHWLVALHDNHINGILADEMGLGKTIQTIAWFAYWATKGNWGPHLIIVPTTIIVNWEIEFKKWCPSFKILSYYGSQKERKLKRYGWYKSNTFHVCITSYKWVIQDYSIFKRKRWYYIVLDEAHNIKNFKSKRWQMLLNFRSRRKLLLTGTPWQNDIMEIWSYLHFLMPNLFYSNDEFREWFHTQFYNAIHNNSTISKQIITSLHSILRPFLLRRLKKDVEKQLPAKIEHVVYCEWSRRQRYLYDEYINTDLTQDTLKRNDYFSIMNVLMQLRKVCNHPDLFDSRDYSTSVRSLFEIVYYFPALAANLFKYNPMKSINYKKWKLYLLANEKYSTWDYAQMVQYFPEIPWFEIWDEVTRNKTHLYEPKYWIDENDILFKKNYADNTIWNVSNSNDVLENIFKMTVSLSSSMSGDKEKDLKKLRKEYNKSGYNWPLPKYICSTNIPILQNNSMNNYYDIWHDIDTSEWTENQPYIKSVFNEAIARKKLVSNLNKKKILHTYDVSARQDIIRSKPFYGANGLKWMKLSMYMDNVHATGWKAHLIYGSGKGNNVVITKIMNKGYKYANYVKVSTKEEDIEDVYEGYNEWERKEEEEEQKRLKEEEERKWREEEEQKRLKEEEGNQKKQEEEEENRGQLMDNETIKKQEETGCKWTENNENVPGNTNDNNNNNNTNNHIPETKVEIQPAVLDNPINPIIKDNNDFDIEMNTETPPIIEPKKCEKPVQHISFINDKFNEVKSEFTSADTIYHSQTVHLQNLVYTPADFLALCDEVNTYFRICIPKVISPGPRFVLSRKCTHINKKNNEYQALYNNWNRISNVVKYWSLFKTISAPDRKLVEYDSGKLIKLALLLKKLYANKSKALIFTQMTRVWDIWEIFLNIHGFTYVRLDGSTRVELRQQIVDKFNTDEKVFCFISSTRSGGIGLNLTGADSIIFFDTDWNPAMDKQAQDRCHRIGQTRTVNIYRWITWGTIEENIFKKSLQKRELNYVIVEEGKFDLKTGNNKWNLKNIIDEENLIKQNKNEHAQDDTKNGTINPNKAKENLKTSNESKMLRWLEFENLKLDNETSQKHIEQMLIRFEEEEDVQATKKWSKEIWDEYEKENDELRFFKDEDKGENKDTKENEMLEKLKPIDRFSINYFKEEYPYIQFVKEKEARLNTNYNLYNSDDNNNSYDNDSIDWKKDSESDNNMVDNLDLDQAYELYLKKKDEITKMYATIEEESKDKAMNE